MPSPRQEDRPGFPQNAPARLSSPSPFPWHLTFYQNDKHGARESRICGRKADGRQIREFCVPFPEQFVIGKWFLLDKCTREGHPLRKGRRGVSAIWPSRFLFAFLPEEEFSLQLEKQAGKGTAKSRFRKYFCRNEDWNLAACGQQCHALRREKVFIAASGARSCGGKTAILRTFSLKSVNRYKLMCGKSFCLGRKGKRVSQQR